MCASFAQLCLTPPPAFFLLFFFAFCFCLFYFIPSFSFLITFSISMYIMCVCLFSDLSRRVGALQTSIIIIIIMTQGSSFELEI